MLRLKRTFVTEKDAKQERFTRLNQIPQQLRYFRARPRLLKDTKRSRYYITTSYRFKPMQESQQTGTILVTLWLHLHYCAHDDFSFAFRLRNGVVLLIHFQWDPGIKLDRNGIESLLVSFFNGGHPLQGNLTEVILHDSNVVVNTAHTYMPQVFQAPSFGRQKDYRELACAGCDSRRTLTGELCSIFGPSVSRSHILVPSIFELLNAKILPIDFWNKIQFFWYGDLKYFPLSLLYWTNRPFTCGGRAADTYGDIINLIDQENHIDDYRIDDTHTDKTKNRNSERVRRNEFGVTQRCVLHRKVSLRCHVRRITAKIYVNAMFSGQLGDLGYEVSEKVVDRRSLYIFGCVTPDVCGIEIKTPGSRRAGWEYRQEVFKWPTGIQYGILQKRPVSEVKYSDESRSNEAHLLCPTHNLPKGRHC